MLLFWLFLNLTLAHSTSLAPKWCLTLVAEMVPLEKGSKTILGFKDVVVENERVVPALRLAMF